MRHHLMAHLKIFIGSSLAGRPQAKALVKALRSKTVSFLPWWEVFKPGSIFLENMDLLRDKLDGALLVFSPEEAEKIEKSTMEMPSMEVLFEFCYLCGHLGKGRVAMVKYGEYFLPKDFGGYVWITGNKEFRRGRAVVVEENTKADFLAWTLTLA